jgi:cyclophilin family peptidyl-prolyl cis-trans isomerase
MAMGHTLLGAVLVLALLSLAQSAKMWTPRHAPVTTSTGKQEYVRCLTAAWDPEAVDFIEGSFTIEMHQDWAPVGYARFMELVRAEFFTDQIIFRTIPQYFVQFGLASSPELQEPWNDKTLQDDKKVQRSARASRYASLSLLIAELVLQVRGLSYDKGFVSMAANGKNARETQVILADMPHGRTLGKGAAETPFGKIVDHPDILESFHHHGYDIYPGLFVSGLPTSHFHCLCGRCATLRGPGRYGDVVSLQTKLMHGGNDAAKEYPKLPRIKTCTVVLKEQVEFSQGTR